MSPAGLPNLPNFRWVVPVMAGLAMAGLAMVRIHLD